jgi:hypothetical protein
MKNIRFAHGTNIYDFFVIPTIRFSANFQPDMFLTIEWLKWFVGIVWE